MPQWLDEQLEAARLMAGEIEAKFPNPTMGAPGSLIDAFRRYLWVDRSLADGAPSPPRWREGQLDVAQRIATEMEAVFPEPAMGLPQPLYGVGRRYVWTKNIEVVCFASGDPDGNVDMTLLFLRPANAPHYANEYAVPGLFPTGGWSLGQAIGELEKKHGITFVSRTAGIVGFHWNHSHPLGPTKHLILLCDRVNATESAKDPFVWANVDSLPRDTIWHHQQYIIPIALKAYRDGALGYVPR